MMDAVTKAMARDLAQKIDQQAEDDGLWFVAQTAPEGYLQQELRELHRIAEVLTERLRILAEMQSGGVRQ